MNMNDDDISDDDIFIPVSNKTDTITPSALRYAAQAYAALDRRSPEAVALSGWLRENAPVLGYAEVDLPEATASHARRPGITIAHWETVGSVLAGASADHPHNRARVTEQWVTAISQRLGFGAVEAAVFALAAHYDTDRRTERLLDKLSDANGAPMMLRPDSRLIGLLLGEAPERVERCLAADSKLLASGLLFARREGELHTLDRLTWLIRGAVPPGADFYDQLTGEPRAASLPWEAFDHLGRDAELASNLVCAALAKGKAVNVLLYGPPGTGKTTFAASLAARAGAKLRPVVEADGSGNEPSRLDRLHGLRLAQRLAVPGETVLLFDETEDLFAHDEFESESKCHSRVFLHRLLEQGTAPVIWTANNIGTLGPTVLRRMTMCLEMRIPNLTVRTRLWRRLGENEGLPFAETDAARLARLVPAAPAVAATAVRAAKLVGGDAETARTLVEGVARAIRGGYLPPAEPEASAEYDPALINADTDLVALADTLCGPSASRAVSFLLSGPPGAGKTAWVRHLAGRMGLPVLQRRASDLLDCYLGETEKNIAAAFAEARETPAFLVFDEADSFLLDRADAVRSWEISHVNEMLTWMEAHDQPFACTTNLVERLDRASLRRFLVKLRFGWLREAQARAAFRRFFGLAAPGALDALHCLTPADFALVKRQAVLRGMATDAEALVRLLAAECEGRTGGRGRLGFAREAA